MNPAGQWLVPDAEDFTAVCYDVVFQIFDSALIEKLERYILALEDPVPDHVVFGPAKEE